MDKVDAPGGEAASAAATNQDVDASASTAPRPRLTVTAAAARRLLLLPWLPTSAAICSSAVRLVSPLAAQMTRLQPGFPASPRTARCVPAGGISLPRCRSISRLRASPESVQVHGQRRSYAAHVGCVRLD
jgi:hypothetical protein